MSLLQYPLVIAHRRVIENKMLHATVFFPVFF